MKAVLLRSIPPGHVIDVTHDLPAHAVTEAAFVLRSIGEQFPAGTIHVAVVDPGVGSARVPLMVQCADGSVLVGPDNGILAPLAHALGRPRGFRIDPSRLGGGPREGTTFDGRDLFAPTAALLARGVRPPAWAARTPSATSVFRSRSGFGTERGARSSTATRSGT